MQAHFFHPGLSLRVKLVLSYLLVTLGAILMLALTVALVVQNYFTNVELQQLRGTAAFQAPRYEDAYRHMGNWNGVSLVNVKPNDPDILVIADIKGSHIICVQPAFISHGNCNDPTLTQALTEVLHGQSDVHGTLSVATENGTFSSLFVSVPLHNDGQIIGAMFLSIPAPYTDDFLAQVNQAILIVGMLVALIVVLFSFVLARRFTRPIESLTSAAEQVKRGKYTQRVTPLKSQDELGQLSLAFNEMADTIEADVNELRRQEQVRRDLIANIAHDLATPLTAIQGFSEALADDMIPDSATRQETAQRIGREVQRLRRLVADMQQMSSLESGHAHLDLAPLDIHSLVDETLTVIAPECEQAGLSVHNEISPEVPPVLADSDRVTQVLLNLLDNARRHTPTGGSITIGAMPKEKLLHVWIADTGIGIDAPDLPHIFERFYRADRSRTGATGGSGLGLSIVKAIITAHRGTIWAESTPGEGTRVNFTLPLAV